MRNHIRSYRKKLNLTLEDLASKIGMTDGNLSKLERGHIGYTQSTIESIARELGCSVIDLISETAPLNSREEKLIEIMRSLNHTEQDRLLRIATTLFASASASEAE